MSSFTGVVHQNKFLGIGGTDVNAIVSIRSVVPPVASPVRGGRLVVGLCADGSGSMSGDKWKNAKQALLDSVEKLPPSCEFFVIIGRTAADVVVPLQYATPENKTRALQTLRATDESGGTRFAQWLETARGEFERSHGDMRVLVFLTDGENDEDGDDKLEAELRRCTGRFEVESRGVGDQYRPDQLRLIQHALGGSIDIIRTPADLSADFTAIVDRASLLAMSDVYLQVWTPVGAKLRMIKQFGNEILDLTSKVIPGPNARTIRIPTGHWGEETRDYHVVVELADTSVGKVGDTKLCARVSLIYREGGKDTEIKLDEGGQVLAIWTDDDKQSAVINPRVANYTGQAELSQRVQEGIKALEVGDHTKATAALQRANELAEQTGHEATQKLIRKLTEVDERGTMRIKKNVDKMDVVELDTRSTRTARTKKVGS